MGKTSTFAVAAMVAATVTTAAKASPFSTSAYVQDGLVACWDGIGNAGAGVHADNVAVWKDVIGGYEFVLTNVTVGANCMTFAATTSSSSAVGTRFCPRSATCWNATSNRAEPSSCRVRS